MLDFLLADANVPFAVALVLMLFIGLLEGTASLFGAGFSHVLDSLVPDVDIGVDVDVAPDGLGSQSALSKLLGWLRVGKVPVLILLVVFLTTFGLIGYIGQYLIRGVAGFYLPATLASVGALAASIPVLRLSTSVLERILPRDETSAVSHDTFIGRTAVITLGTARRGTPAQARLRDRHGQTHYVMVEPDSDEDFPTGTVVLLVKRDSAIFQAIRNTKSVLDAEHR